MPIDKCKPLEVRVGDYRTFEAAVKKFRKKVEKEGRLREALKRQYYTKPSQLKHNKRRTAAYIRDKYGS